jgi:tRNA dimethylallyltransferase
MNTKPKIIVVLGQTATGKSDFAVQVAKEIKGEIISADSRQVYKGLDIGTGKINKKDMQKIPYYLLDVALPRKTFSVSMFKKLADKKSREIFKKGKVPIIVGGTGFYIDAVVDGIVLPEVEPNKKLRATLEKKSAQQLFSMLKKLDPVRAKTIDQSNPVRLIRAIEIASALGSVPKVKIEQKYDVLKIGLALPDEVLKVNIQTRLAARMKKGMLKEIQKLHTDGLSWKRLEALGLEYRYGALHLQGKITKQEMIEKLNTEICHYAKRQKTWFKRDKDIIWIDPREIHEKAKAMKKVKEFLKP